MPTGDGASVALPSAALIADGRFERSGVDLRITDPDGNEIVVRDYFAGDSMPDLTSPDGAQILTPQLVESFLLPLAPGQYAQAAGASVALPIGQVTDLEGDAVAVRADGSRVQLAKGDAVFEGDVVETGGHGSAIRMVFSDKTEFSLGADARLALDQLVFNPDTQTGSAQFSVLKGVFIFASGQIAKTDNTDMTVTTPVATIGIRGTEVAGRVDGSNSQFTIIDGAIEVTTQAGSVTLDDRGETTQVAGIDSLPTDPVVLTPAQFGQAYGEVSGVVSTYFGQGQPDGGGDPGGGIPHDNPAGGQSDPSPSDSGDHTDAGAPGGMMLASALPADAPVVPGPTDPVSLGTAFAIEPAGTAFSSLPLSAPSLDPLASIASASAPQAMPGFGQTSASGSETGNETVIAAVPGLDFGGGLTFEGNQAGTGGNAGFSLGPSGTAADPTGGAGGDGTVPVAFTPLPGGPGGSGPAIAGEGLEPVEASPLDLPSGGASGSPFRSESNTSDPIAANPYVSQPFGYTGPQVGDPVFNLVASSASSAPDTGSPPADDPDNVEVSPAASPAAAAAVATATPAAVSMVADITLIVSNATIGQKYQDLTNNSNLPNEGPDSFVLVSGAAIDLPGVPNDAEIALQRDTVGNVDVTLNSAWNSVKNIRAESATAADLHVKNFVDVDVDFGGGGDSEIVIVDAKRGNLRTGDGDDSIDIEATSNGNGWSHLFDVSTGAGDDTMSLAAAGNRQTKLTFDGGDGIDTLKFTGSGTSFDLSSGNYQITGVERIDISGSSNVTLSLSSDLLNGSEAAVNALTSTSHTLVVDGDAGDTLDLQDAGWSFDHNVDIESNGGSESYAVYSHSDGMQVAVDSDVTVV